MKLIALQTIHGVKVLRAPKTDGDKDKGQFQRDLILPRIVDHETGEIVREGTFDPADYGISDAEVKAMIKAGAVRVMTREVPVEDEAEETDPQGEDPDATSGVSVSTRGGRRRTLP